MEVLCRMCKNQACHKPHQDPENSKLLMHWNQSSIHSGVLRITLSPISLIVTKTLWSFGHSECNRVYVPKG